MRKILASIDLSSFISIASKSSLPLKSSISPALLEVLSLAV